MVGGQRGAHVAAAFLELRVVVPLVRVEDELHGFVDGHERGDGSARDGADDDYRRDAEHSWQHDRRAEHEQEKRQEKTQKQLDRMRNRDRLVEERKEARQAARRQEARQRQDRATAGMSDTQRAEYRKAELEKAAFGDGHGH